MKDNGCGMDAETRARLFNLLTTKNPGAGTGMGLATVERIVGETGGRIEVQSDPGRGTCIEVFFPAVKYDDERFERGGPERGERDGGAAGPAGKGVLQTSHKAILLVDDNAAARKSVRRRSCSVPVT